MQIHQIVVEIVQFRWETSKPNDLYIMLTYLWLSTAPLDCWKTSWCPALWTKPCMNSIQHALESPSPSQARSQWGGEKKRVEISPPLCWKTMCRKGGSPVRRRRSVRGVSPHMQQVGRAQRTLWCCMLELEGQEWRMIWKDRERSCLGMML